MRLAWCTDIHMDSADTVGIEQLCSDVRNMRAESLLLSGDISRGSQIVQHLADLEARLAMPIYFVAGNHDYYDTSVARGRRVLGELTAQSTFLRYLPTVPYLSLTKATALVGHDGWYDCQNGDTSETHFVMSDWSAIEEFASGWIMPRGMYSSSGDPGRFTNHITSTARTLAQVAVDHVAAGIKAAVRARHKNVLIVTHFPPFVQSVQGHRAKAGYLPWYSSRVMGETIIRAAEAYPRVRFTVLSGHTHTRWSGTVRKNVAVHVGGAQYGRPEVQLPVDVE